MMNSKEIKEEKRLLSCNRDKRNILVIENLEYAFNTLKENPEKYDYEMKKILVENLYENIKFLFAFPDLKVMFEKMGFSKDMNLNNKKDVDLLYNYLVELVKTHYGDYSLAFTIYNHKSQEFHRKDIEKEKGFKIDMDKIIEDSLYFFRFQWSCLCEIDDE